MNKKCLLTVARLVDVTRHDARDAGTEWGEYAFEAAKALMALALVGEYRVPAGTEVTTGKATAR